jgi:pantoate--beta-alanine ligase
MIHCTNIDSVQAQIKQWKHSGQSVAFVPTMGNLHEGHLTLVKRARERADRVVASIFVNPLQFNEMTDFDAYPRTFDQDSHKLEQAGTDLLFSPSIDDIYPLGQEKATKVIVPELGDILEGEHRPGHFTGVATVVNKLFNIVQPDVACFGEKDFQQLMLIRRMVNELDMPVKIESVSTVREADGLAISSRNNRLSEQHRNIANVIYQGLSRVQQGLDDGRRDYSVLENEAIESIKQQGLLPEYVSIRRSADLELPLVNDKELVILAAARLGDVRLIDNIPLNL